MSKPPKTKIYPPFYFIGAVLLMIALHKFFPITRWVNSPWQRFGIVVMVFAFFNMVMIKRMFDKVHTPIKPFEHSTRLVDYGPFRFSRNPVYLSMVLGLVGLATVLGTASPILVIVVFVWAIQARFIVPEERMLLEDFGAEYEAYKTRVRRWI